jgi:hypothetical protein
VEFTIRELAEKVLSLTASKSRQPKVALDDGLKQTVRYFREPLAQ